MARSGGASFLADSAQTGVARVVMAGLTLAAGVVNARWLGVEGVGVLALLVLMRHLLVRCGTLGFPSAYAYFVAQGRFPARAALASATLLGVALAAGSALLFGIASRVPGSPWHDIAAAFVIVTLGVSPIAVLGSLYERLLGSELEIGHTNAARLLGSLAYLLGLAVLVVLLELDLWGALGAMFLLEGAATGYMWIQLRRLGAAAPEERTEPPSLGEMFRYGRWNYLITLLQFLAFELPLALLKALTGQAAVVGLFSRARTLLEQFQVIVVPVSYALFPYTAASDAERSVQRTLLLCRMMSVVLAPLVIGTCVVAEPLIELLYGAGFLGAVPMFYALAPAVLVRPINQFLGIHLAATGTPQTIARISLVTTLVSIGVSVLSIRAWGGVGAGASISVMFVVDTAFRIAAFSRLTGRPVRDVLVPRRGDWSYLLRAVRYARTRLSSRSAR